MAELTLDQQKAVALASARARAADADTSNAPAPYNATNAEIAVNAAGKALPGLADSVLNAPNEALNLGKAAVGSVMTAAGHPPDANGPLEILSNPDYARKLAEHIGLIRPQVVPQGPVQQGIDLGVQGAVQGAATGGASYPAIAKSAAMGTGSALATGATQAATDNPALAATVGLATGGKAAFEKSPESVAAKNSMVQSQNMVRDATLERARAAGYVVPPSAVEPSFVGDRLEGIAGKAALGQQAAINNQTVTNKLARDEAGLEPHQAISQGSLQEARDKMAAPYEEVAAMSKRAATALTLLKQARSDAKVQWQFYDRSADPSALAKAKALDAQAQTYEDTIDYIASKYGPSNVLAKLRDARTKLAKNFDVERALNVGTGDVDATVLGRMLDKGKPMTGDSETIGRFANAFPHYARDASRVPAPGVSKLEGVGALALGLGGAPFGLGAVGALPLVAPHAARAYLLSPPMQGRPNYAAPGPSVSRTVPPITTAGALAELQRQSQQ